MPKILIVNGPNLNLLGTRQPHIYGNQTFESFLDELKPQFPRIELEYYVSNHEGMLIDKIQQSDAHALVVNFGAYTHSSLALGDCLANLTIPVVEVHISNLYAREQIRHTSLTAPYCKGLITGLGLQGYKLALIYLCDSILCPSL